MTATTACVILKGVSEVRIEPSGYHEYRESMSKVVDYLMSQFKNPRGFLGRIAGTIMASRPSNRERNDWTLSLLKITPHDRVLEIGFGPGWAIGEAAKRASMVVGIDHSPLMVKVAAKRNRAAIRQGKVKLILGSIENGSVDDLRTAEAPFDKMFSSNVAQFWKNPAAVFPKLLSLLKPGGTMATTYQPRGGAQEADGEDFAAGIARTLGDAGFVNISIERKPMKPVTAFSVLAARPALTNG